MRRGQIPLNFEVGAEIYHCGLLVTFQSRFPLPDELIGQHYQPGGVVFEALRSGRYIDGKGEVVLPFFSTRTDTRWRGYYIIFLRFDHRHLN